MGLVSKRFSVSCALVSCMAAALLIGGCDAFSSLSIPAPDGFVGTSKEFPKAYAWVSKLVVLDKRVPMAVAEFMIEDKDATVLRSGHGQPALERYLVDVRNPDDPYFSEDQFEQYVLHVRNQGLSAPSDALLRQLIDQAPDMVGPNGELATSMSIHGDTNLGIAVDQPHAIGNAYVMLASVDGESRRMVMVSESVWLRGHIVTLKVFSRLRDASDLKWAREEAGAWAAKAATANR